MDTLKHFFTQYKKPLFIIGFSLLFFFVFSEVGFAEETSSTTWNKADDIIKLAVDLLNGVLKIAAALLGVLTAFVSLFLYPGWTNGTLFGLQEYLREMWILISNVVYFVFAFILVAIAFMNIIGKGDKWELKSALPRFIVWVLIVPFSWFFVQFILSLSAILTVWVLTLPYDLFQDKDFFSEADSDMPICLHLELNLSWWASSDAGDSELDKSLWQYMNCKEETTISEVFGNNGTGEWNGVKNSIFGIVSIYTYGVLSVDGLDTVSKGDISDYIKTLADLTLKIVFDIIFVLVYFILMAALFLALFVRGVWLWMYIMFSPAFGLLYFFEKGKDGVGEWDNKFSITEFISLALVPVYVSAALSFGLVFLFVASQWIQTEAKSDKDTLDLAGFKLTILWAHGDSKTESSALARLIIQIFGIAMLWIAVMAALKQSETTKKITAPIAQFGSSVGSLVASAPMYAPIIPAGMNWERVSATGLWQMGQEIHSSFRQDAVSKWSTFAQDILGKSPWVAADSAQANAYMQDRTELDRGAIDKVNKTIRGAADFTTLVWEKGFHKSLTELARLLKLSDTEKKEFESYRLWNTTDLAKAIWFLEAKIEAKGGFWEWLLPWEQKWTKPSQFTPDIIDKYIKDMKSSNSDDSNGNTTINQINLNSSSKNEIQSLLTKWLVTKDNNGQDNDSNKRRLIDIIDESIWEKQTIKEGRMKEQLKNLGIKGNEDIESIISTLRVKWKVDDED